MIPPPHIPPTPQVRRRYVCHRAAATPDINGRLDKPFWHGAPWTDDFVDIEGVGGPANRPLPRHRTRAKMLWDDRYLYVGAEMEEPHVWATLTDRDSIVYHDNDFEVFLNPTCDSHNYYELEVNALNTIFDLFLSKPYRDGGPADHGWDVKGLLAAVHIDGTLNDPRDTDRGWSVELAFPWSAFDRHGARSTRARQPGACLPRALDVWRINFSRVHWDTEVVEGKYRKIQGRPEHNWVWSPQGVIDMHRPEQWGDVLFAPTVAGAAPIDWPPDESEPARELLHRIYYAQLAHKAAHSGWAESLAALTFPCPLPAKHPHATAASRREERPGLLPDSLYFALTDGGWAASAAVRDSRGGIRRWRITHDSRICESDGSSAVDRA